MSVRVYGISFALLTLAACCLCALPSLNPRKLVFDDVDKVCYVSYRTLHSLFSGMKMENSFVDDGITIKPAEVPRDSPCYGMQSTCCLQSEEKGMIPLVELEYHQKLKNILQKRLKSCNGLGRSIERATYQDIFESDQLLQAEISGAMGETISKEVFQDFFQFLYRFIHVRDFCQLSFEIEGQIKKLYRYYAERKAIRSLVEGPCSEQFEKHFVDTWFNSSLNSLVQSLNNLRLMSEVFELTQSLLSNIKQHKFSHQCTDALFRLRHCSYCVGNYYDIPVCEGHCINTFRGCMADLYELRPHVRNLQDKLESITLTANIELTPIRFLQTTLMEFVHFIRHLNRIKISDTKMVVNETCTILDDSVVAQVEQDQMLHYITSHEHGSSSRLKEALEKDLKCFIDAKSVLSEIDEEMCDVNPKHIKYIRNKSCWNGTHSKGSYKEALVGKARIDQNNNPAFRSFSSKNSYENQVLQINRLIHEINQTNQFYDCLKSDDEDCQLFLLECKATIPTNTNDDEFHSGSGSGSGSGWSHSSNPSEPNDVEYLHTQSVLILLGGPRRYNDEMKNTEDPSDNKPIDNDEEKDNETNVVTNEMPDGHNDSELYTTSNNDSDIGPTNQTEGYLDNESSENESTSPSQTPDQAEPPDIPVAKPGSSGSVVYNSISILLSTLFLCYLSLYIL